MADYIEAAHGAGIRELRFVHCRNCGIQRGIVQTALERPPLVERSWDDHASHLGATLARLVNAASPRSA